MADTTDHAAVVINPILICVVAVAVATVLQRLVPLPFLATGQARLLGGVVFFLGFLFGLPAARTMRQSRTTLNPARTTTALVTSGIFRLSRNPIYIAMLFNFAGIVIFFGSLWGLLLFPIVLLALDRWVIVPEEQYLNRLFPDEFSEYRKSVRRWL